MTCSDRVGRRSTYDSAHHPARNSGPALEAYATLSCVLTTGSGFGELGLIYYIHGNKTSDSRRLGHQPLIRGDRAVAGCAAASRKR